MNIFITKQMLVDAAHHPGTGRNAMAPLDKAGEILLDGRATTVPPVSTQSSQRSSSRANQATLVARLLA
jgi:hypothetical protein